MVSISGVWRYPSECKNNEKASRKGSVARHRRTGPLAKIIFLAVNERQEIVR